MMEDLESRKQQFIQSLTDRDTLFFVKHYLTLEVEQLESTLQHFFDTDTINKDDYEYLLLTFKMIKKFLGIHLKLKKKPATKSQLNSKQATLFDMTKPFPISGTIEVSGLKESLSALRPVEASTSPKFPYKIYAGTNWSDIIIKFLNQEQVEIWIKGLKHITTYQQMGMVGKGNKPSEQWIFLKVLALCNGEINIKDESARNKYKMQKKLLSEKLKQYFSIDYDPFYPYQKSSEKPESSYKIKLTLIPPTQTEKPARSDTEYTTDKLGIKEHLEDISPQIYDGR